MPMTPRSVAVGKRREASTMSWTISGVIARRRLRSGWKNGVTPVRNVSTTSERSKNRFPRSHDVSGANKHAWHASP